MKHAKLTLGPRQAELLFQIALMGLADMEIDTGPGKRYSQQDYKVADDAITKLVRAMNREEEVTA
jgi:hypothetical protein